MGKFTEFKLPLKSLSHGLHEFDYKLDKTFFANMESAEIRDADLDVKLTVDYRNDNYALHFAVKGSVTTLCDRCLDDLVLPIDASYDINVEYGDDYNDDSDDLLIIPDSDNTLNVAYMLYDTVVLALPIKRVHPAGKCNRAMSALLKKHQARADVDEAMLGEDASEAAASDPRWDALKGLSDTLDNEE